MSAAKGKGVPDPGSGLMEVLARAQAERGWLSPETLSETARALGLPEAQVRGTATFYSMFRTRPAGRHLIGLCTNISCMVLGAQRLVDLLRSKYGLEPGGTTPDGRFSLVIMECIGACGTAPAMLVDSDLHENLTQERLEKILEAYR